MAIDLLDLTVLLTAGGWNGIFRGVVNAFLETQDGRLRWSISGQTGNAPAHISRAISSA
jgi:hypothetical protein